MTKVAKVKVVKEVRLIGGKKLSLKLPKEVEAMVSTIKGLDKGKFYSYDNLFKTYLTELKKISSSKSNLETRFRRLLYRNVETGLVKGSIQSVKFNLATQLQGLKIKSKKVIEYKSNGDANIISVKENEYTFNILKSFETRKELEITADILKRINDFKGTE